MALQLRSKYQTFRNPRFVCHLSSSSDSGEDKNDPPSTSTVTSPPSLSAYFSDIKSKLKESSPPPRVSSSPSSGESFSFASSRPSKPASLEEIRKSLSEFRRRSTSPPPHEGSSSTSSGPTISFQDLYKRNVIEKGEDERSGVGGSTSGKLSFEAIRESLRQVRASSENQNVKDRVRGSGDRGSRMLDPMSLMAFRDSLKMKPEDRPNSSVVHGGSEPLPASVFGKELREKTEKESQELKTEFLRTYTYGQLGDKLRKLRPAETKGDKNWFSLSELNQRLVNLREMEEQEASSRISGVSFKDLRECLVKMHTSDSDRAKRSSIQRLDILGQFRGTPSYMMAPPKEHLVEKYFHPDNMSSSEKMKLELKKVRDEFKMSESDCGSARVQVAQLTTKIKHLSSVLHKKDKHSRKGVLAMVQRRKMLLKYLRRTDWDSYCFVLGKLGLRDNPDYKN